MPENPAPLLSVEDLFPQFSRALARGETRWRLPGLPVELTPLRVSPDNPRAGDAPELERIYADRRVQAYIENAANTTLAELVELAREGYRRRGAAVRFGVRDASGALLGVMNCLKLPAEVVAWNEGLMGRLLAPPARFCGELAYYHARGSADLITLPPGERNRLSERTRRAWLARLQQADFQRQNAAFAAEIAQTTSSLEQIAASTRQTVLCSRFALGYAVLTRLLFEMLAEAGVGEQFARLLLFSDADNRASLRMLLPFGARLEGFCHVPNPDATRRARVLLSQPAQGIAAFLTYYHEHAQKD